MNWHKIYIHNIPSTNDTLESFIKSHEAKPFDVLICNSQTGGHGRFDRVWQSPKGNIAMSLALPIDNKLVYQIGVIAALALRITFSKFVSKAVNLKWPNDVLIDGKKICGILSKCLHDHNTLILGIGINLNSTARDFSTDIRNNLTTLRDECGNKINQEEFIGFFLSEFSQLFINWQGTGIHSLMNKLNSAYIQSDVYISEQGKVQYPAKIIGIDENCFLQVLQNDGAIRTVHAADITSRKI